MEKQYIISERAHLMCPNMHFGLCAKVNANFEESKVSSTLQELQSKHPFLHSCIAKENKTEKLYYNTEVHKKLEWSLKQEFSCLFEDYVAVTLGGWNVFEEGLLKVMVYPDKNNFWILFVAHHLLCDGRGLLNLMLEFCDLYVEEKHPAYVEERLIQSIKDLPSRSELSAVSKMIIRSANKNWSKENHTVSYEDYLEFEKKFLRCNPIVYEVNTKESQELVGLVEECRQNGVSVNDYLIAKMMLEEETKKVVIAADIRNQLTCYTDGALGNYATAMGIVSKKKTNDLMQKAVEVKRRVKKRMSSNHNLMQVLACYFEMIPELIDAVAISTLGEYESKAGRFVGTSMFGYKERKGYCITNLGKVDSSSMLEAMFIPPASPANRVTEGILTVNGTMKICRASAHKYKI